MFNRRIPAVVEMDVEKLAKDDGSRQAAGRGSGRDDPRWMERRRPRATPYMGMTFWPLERRLDTAIFRAMFASSVRTARQFVVHGHVKVNGKKVCNSQSSGSYVGNEELMMNYGTDQVPRLPPESRRHVQRRSRTRHALHGYAKLCIETEIRV